MWYIYFYYAVLVTAFVYVLRAGGAPEMIAMAIMVLGSIGTSLLTSPSYKEVELGTLAIDLLDQAALLWLMLTSDRFWPIHVFGLHLLEPLIALAKWMTPSVSPGIYARAEHVLAYLILLLVCLGARRHQQRLATLGSDPSWSIC